jgi:hypothetical protein
MQVKSTGSLPTTRWGPAQIATDSSTRWRMTMICTLRMRRLLASIERKLKRLASGCSSEWERTRWPQTSEWTTQKDSGSLTDSTSTIPSFRATAHLVESRAKSRGWIHTIMGRRRRLDYDSAYRGLNFLTKGGLRILPRRPSLTRTRRAFGRRCHYYCSCTTSTISALLLRTGSIWQCLNKLLRRPSSSVCR